MAKIYCIATVDSGTPDLIASNHEAIEPLHILQERPGIHGVSEAEGSTYKPSKALLTPLLKTVSHGIANKLSWIQRKARR